MNNYNFTSEEWEICMKVLSELQNDPFNNPDNTRFKTLISKIHKKAKKDIRKQNAEEKREEDLDALLNTEIAKQAINCSSHFSAAEIENPKKYTRLQSPIGCYSCNTSFYNLHFFYNRLCPICAEYNYNNRFIQPNLKGRTAVLTGARVKVGYATGLKLLRAGARVIATSRFPALSLEQYQAEPDFSEWGHNLEVYGLDLRNLKAVNNFIEHVKKQFDSLDILINNAAQTIQYPVEMYAPLVQNEKLILNAQSGNPMLHANTTPLGVDIALLHSDSVIDYEKNRFGQPVDNRDKNSWNSKLEEISTFELLEVNLINQLSPYLLIKKLKVHMLRSTFQQRFIINVTSSEGQFSYTKKTMFHPHTNMTKAALNMLTHTSAAEFAESNIFMNCVDVGWISTGAKEPLRKKQFEEGYIPPLDSVDGASRILHPIAEALNGNIVYGKLLKNYNEVNW